MAFPRFTYPQKGIALFWLISIFLTFNLSSQNAKKWTIKNDLSGENVEEVIQDASGFLWFASNVGLSRFDGYNFLKFTTSNLPGLPSNEIKTILADNSNKLWIATAENGICLLDLKSYKIIRTFNKNGKSTGLRSNKIASIHRDDNNTIWVATHDGFLYKYLGDDKFTLVTNPYKKDKLFGTYPRLASDNKYVYLYSIDRGVSTIDKKTNKVLANFGTNLFPHSGYISKIEGVGVVFCAKEGVQKINKSKNTFSPIFEVIGPETFTTLKAKNGDLWFVQKDRKVIQILRNGKIQDITSVLFKESDNVHISYIFEDSSNNIWICTTKGVYKVTTDSILFNSILELDSWKSTNYIPSFRGMMEDESGTVFIGGYSGLFKYKDGHVTQLFDNVIPYSPYVLINRNSDELWALCEGYGVILVNKKTGAIQQFDDTFSKIEKYKGIYLTAGAEAYDGHFWLGSYEGMLRFNPTNEKYYVQELFYQNHPIHTYKARQILKTSTNHIWICTNSGVFELDKKNKVIAHYSKSSKGAFWLPFNDVNCILEDHLGNMWVGSRTSGVYRIGDVKSNAMRTNRRLPDNVIASIIEDNQHFIWISTNNGLSKLDPKTGTINNYFLENGLSSNEFNHGSFLCGKNDKLYFGGVNGINIYNPRRDFNQTEKFSYLRISKAEIPTIDNKIQTYFCGEGFKNGISLPYNNAHFYLEFFISDFTHSESNTYEYFIEGLSEEWHSLKNENFLRIVGMASGNYLLKIRGADAQGKLLQDELRIPIHVSQIFYKTWWFIILIVLFFVVLIGFFVYQRFRRQLALSEMRVALASDLHDDVGSALTKVAMQSEMLEDEVDEHQKKILHGMSVEARKAMASMRDMVWSIDSRNMDIDSLFDKINEYIHKSIGELGIPYKLANDPTLKNMRLSPIQKKEIFYIIKESINNAMKHGDGREIRINFYKQNGDLIISVFNTTENVMLKSHSGSGLKNMEMRAQRIGATIEYCRDHDYTLLMRLPLKKTFVFL